jgi:type II secretory pathway pseudopilin PulG
MRVARSSHPRFGFTLTESAIVLGVLGIVLVAIWAAYSALNENNQANRTYAILTELSHNIRTMYANQPPVRAPTDADAGRNINLTLINNGAFPRDLVVTNTGSEDTSFATTPWGVGIYVMLIPPVGLWGYGQGYAIVYVNLPVSQCIRLAQAVVQNRDENTVWLRINGAAGDYNLRTAPPDEETISTRCRAESPVVLAVGTLF